MTKEEIISGLKYTIDMFLFDPSTGETYTEPRNDMDKITIDACRGAIELLEQKPRTGQWEICQDDDGMYGICNICGQDSDFYYYGEVYKYCPNCGARMESEE